MYACICRGYLLHVNAEQCDICICVDFIFFLMKPRRNFGIAQDIVLGLMAVTLSLPKVYPKEGAVFQGWLVLSLLTVTHTHICVSCDVCMGSSQGTEGWVFSRPQFTPKAFQSVCCGLVLSLRLLPPARAKDKFLSLYTLNPSMFDKSNQKIDEWHVKQLFLGACYFVIDRPPFFFFFNLFQRCLFQWLFKGF